MKLKDRTAIITGATSGIGEASAILFAQEGAKVTVTGRNDERGRNVVDAITAAGGSAVFVRADVRLASDCERIVNETLRAFGGRIDILFNNAGVFYPHNSIECTEEEWDATVDSSLKGSWLMAKYSLPIMIAQQSGVIINQASGWGIQGGDEAVAYCAAKGGLVVMTKAMAIDHGKHGIRVNCLCPGDVETPMLADRCKSSPNDLCGLYKRRCESSAWPRRNRSGTCASSSLSRIRRFFVYDRCDIGCRWWRHRRLMMIFKQLPRRF